MKLPYATNEYGNTAIIYAKNLANEKIAYCYFDGDAGKGFHICNLVRKDVEVWIKKNPSFDYEKYKLPNYKEQYFNIDYIEKNVGKEMIGMDVNGCYFNTISKLGYITEKTYELAHKKDKEWKDGRNASVGSLGKEQIFKFNNPEQIKGKKTKPISISDSKKKAIRHHIIGTVWEMFHELMTEVLKGEFYMFLTDCVYVDPKNIEVVQKFFEQKGYTCKNKTYKLTKLDKEHKRIWWWDYVKKKNDGTLGDHKYYNYASTLVYEKS